MPAPPTRQEPEILENLRILCLPRLQTDAILVSVRPNSMDRPRHWGTRMMPRPNSLAHPSALKMGSWSARKTGRPDLSTAGDNRVETGIPLKKPCGGPSFPQLEIGKLERQKPRG